MVCDTHASERVLRSFPDPCSASSGEGELDFVAEMLELVDQVASASVGVVVAGEVVDAEFGVDGAFAEHVPCK